MDSDWAGCQDTRRSTSGFVLVLTCIAWSEGSVGGSDRAKHIDLRQHYVHEAVQAKTLKLEVIASADNVADILTKPLPQASFQLLRKRLLGL